jgi:hypothetical protein
LNDDNPYRPPANDPGHLADSRRWRVGIVLAILAVPAASIAGGITCSTARLAVIPAGHADYESFPLQLLVGVTVGMSVTYAVWRLLRSFAIHWQPDQSPWPPIVVSGWIFALAIPAAIFLAWGALWIGLYVGYAVSPRNDAVATFITAMFSSTAGFGTLLLAWQSWRYGNDGCRTNRIR